MYIMLYTQFASQVPKKTIKQSCYGGEHVDTLCVHLTEIRDGCTAVSKS